MIDAQIHTHTCLEESINVSLYIRNIITTLLVSYFVDTK